MNTQKSSQQNRNRALFWFFILVAAVAVGNGFSDSIMSNYFKDAYNVNAAQRALIEFPRESPGLLCIFIVSALSFMGDLRITLFAQICACIGLMFLGLFSMPFGIMLIFLFINSLGMHLFFPLQDSVGMSLAEPDRVGTRVGQFGSVRTFFSFLAGIAVFIGFRTGIFSFKTDTKLVFVLGSIAFLIASAAAFFLVKAAAIPKRAGKKKISLKFHREYRYYYIIAVLYGVQKQIAFVFGSWVIIEMLQKEADTMSLLIIISSFAGIFFVGILGRFIDRFGVKKMMYVDALTYIVVYVLYGLAVYAIYRGIMPSETFALMAIYVLFVLDRMSMQVGVVKSVYLRSIAKSEEDVTATLSLGLSLDHVVSILAAQVSGIVWMKFGPHWVFFAAAFLSLGNLYAAKKIPAGEVMPAGDMDD